jgi:hypothetical protein
VASASSSKNKAPRALKASSTAWARPLIGAAPVCGASAIHKGARRRSMSAIGVEPTGDTWRARPLPLAAEGGVKRAQDVRPARHWLSSHEA